MPREGGGAANVDKKFLIVNNNVNISPFCLPFPNNAEISTTLFTILVLWPRNSLSSPLFQRPEAAAAQDGRRVPGEHASALPTIVLGGAPPAP